MFSATQMVGEFKILMRSSSVAMRNQVKRNTLDGKAAGIYVSKIQDEKIYTLAVENPMVGYTSAIMS